MSLSSFMFGRVADLRTSYNFFIYEFLDIFYFGLDETKRTRGKLYGELWPVLKYNFKEEN